MVDDRERLRRAVESLERTYDALSTTTRSLMETHSRTALVASRDGTGADWRVPWSVRRRDERSVRDGTPGSLLSLGEAAALTGRHPELLRRWCADGRLRGERIAGSWFVRTSELGRIEAMPTRARRASRPVASAAGVASRLADDGSLDGGDALND